MNQLTGRKQTKEHVAKRVASFKITGRRLGDRKKILIAKIEINEKGCWVWQGSVFKKKDGKDYGQIRVGRKGEDKLRRAHIVSYEEFVGEVPKGLELDHLCRNTLCINPEHLEPITHTENMRRRLDINKTHCKYGHELNDENLYINSRGARECRVCRRNRR